MDDTCIYLSIYLSIYLCIYVSIYIRVFRYKYRLGYCEVRLSDLVSRQDTVVEFKLINPQKKSFNAKLLQSHATVLVSLVGLDHSTEDNSLLKQRQDGSWGTVALTVLYEIFKHFAWGFHTPSLPPHRCGLRLKSLHVLCKLTGGPTIKSEGLFIALCEKYNAEMVTLSASECQSSKSEKALSFRGFLKVYDQLYDDLAKYQKHGVLPHNVFQMDSSELQNRYPDLYKQSKLNPSNSRQNSNNSDAAFRQND